MEYSLYTWALAALFFFNEVLFLLIKKKKKLMIWKILLVPKHETEEVG